MCVCGGGRGVTLLSKILTTCLVLNLFEGSNWSFRVNIKELGVLMLIL